MAVTHKDWELPNWRIIDIESDLEFPSKLASRPIMFCGKKVANYNAKTLTIYYIKVSGIPSGNKLIKTIRYPHMYI